MAFFTCSSITPRLVHTFTSIPTSKVKDSKKIDDDILKVDSSQSGFGKQKTETHGVHNALPDFLFPLGLAHSCGLSAVTCALPTVDDHFLDVLGS